MTASAMPAERRRISPYAKRLARERGITLELLSGSGPSGRIVAADIVAFVPRVAVQPSSGFQATALGASIDLGLLRQLLAGFAQADTPIELDDIMLRAAGSALHDIPGISDLDGRPIAVETRVSARRLQVVLDNVRNGSLTPLRARRLAALASDIDQSAVPAVLSLRLLTASDIRPIAMPLLAGRAMRLVLAVGPNTAECLLSFDAGAVNEEDAGEFLVRFKGYLEVPLRLLA